MTSDILFHQSNVVHTIGARKQNKKNCTQNKKEILGINWQKVLNLQFFFFFYLFIRIFSIYIFHTAFVNGQTAERTITFSVCWRIVFFCCCCYFCEILKKKNQFTCVYVRGCCLMLFFSILCVCVFAHVITSNL